jgi:CRP-like cAMP-binding protein
MITPFLRKIEHLAPLTEIERTALVDADLTIRHVDARTDILIEGQPPDSANLVIDGFACRYKLLPDGRRQIVSYLLPGDFCETTPFLLRNSDHSVASLSRVKLAVWPQPTIQHLTDTHPGITRALWWATFLEESITREWLVSIGQRTALERLAHLICEIYFRLDSVGRTNGGSFEMPITQAELADTLGLSVVHVNRTLQEMRRDGLVRLSGKILSILDLPMLQTISMFNPSYLNLGKTPSPRAEKPFGRPDSAGDHVQFGRQSG